MCLTGRIYLEEWEGGDGLVAFERPVNWAQGGEQGHGCGGMLVGEFPAVSCG